MITHSIQTKLVGKEEIFRVMAVGEAMGIPVLLIGTPGVAKTQGALDYSQGRKAFICQLSIGTKPHELRGYIDMDAMVGEKKFRTVSPIADADTIIIDEVDKAYGEIKNVLLSVMREHELFLGSEGVRKCNWKSFVGCCNVIPKDITNNPFWDRFVLKYNVDRLNVESISKIWVQPMTTFKVNVPEPAELQPDRYLIELAEKVAGIMYSDTTDRTLTYLPRLIKACDVVWDTKDYIQSTLRAVAFLNPSKITEVAQVITPKEIAEIMNEIGFLSTVRAKNQLNKMYMQLVGKIRSSIQQPSLQNSMLERAQQAREQHPLYDGE